MNCSGCRSRVAWNSRGSCPRVSCCLRGCRPRVSCCLRGCRPRVLCCPLGALCLRFCCPRVACLLGRECERILSHVLAAVAVLLDRGVESFFVVAFWPLRSLSIFLERTNNLLPTCTVYESLSSRTLVTTPSWFQSFLCGSCRMTSNPVWSIGRKDVFFVHLSCCWVIECIMSWCCWQLCELLAAPMSSWAGL